MNPIVERERGLLELEQRIADLKAHAADQPLDLSSEIRALEAKYTQIQREIFGRLTPWQRVNMARHPKRPLGMAYLAALDAFDELHGDREFGDDPAVVGGFAKLAGRRVIAIAQEKGGDTKDKVRRNFGMPKPEGYRKVRRLVRLAAHLQLPVVTFVDTSGADPGISSEERAQSEAIAQSLAAFAEARVPIVATIIGEGGSGGALALALADHLLMLEHAVYSVASPEGCAAILWGDAGKAEEAAERLHLTSDDLRQYGIADEVIAEPLGGAHRDPRGTIGRVLTAVDRALSRLAAISVDELIAERYRKYRRIGGASVTSRVTGAGRLGRVLARVGAAGVAAIVAVVIVVQFARIIERNVAYARALGDVQRDIAVLENKRGEQQREIRRLSDPQGAIPEIHDRLHLVGDGEAIIYLRR